MPQLRTPTILAIALAFLVAPPAVGDWRTLAVNQVDFEGSEETTALKAGRPYVPALKVSEPAPAAHPTPAAPETADGDEPRIVLYMTSWCGYCRKARKLLTQLDADFVAKDIEKSPEAALEYSAKSGGRGGVPLIDFDGKIVRGYSDRTIRKLVHELRDKYGDT